ncbi:DUF5060 domain-containing protein [Lactobacillus delbrueckii subsp. indicus]|uniref:DUF5060 domain-containing protein n=1 Tax=Lactobacillus delbrueckii TaxID=1584 RepID=UPI002222AC4C|nr:DUF5060 domain-containing protein [Lactobacillus delbrueckii]UYX12584.1 DUF5060 domain-containing protein [Lactobacillus delbrueckii]UYY84399.1 DUF5060 domain-containing protein [Lactobacillus delbrueckii subsp. indicus]
MQTIEKWRRYELTLTGPSTGNPFTDVELTAEFTHDGKKITVDGFYDGKGVYKVRYMPQETGEFSVATHSNVAELDGKTNEFTVVEASGDNHGPVVVSGKTHFAYADGTPYVPFGTTAYAWTVQPKEIQEQTLETLQTTCFNKIRMLVFPKSYDYNTKEPAIYPFAGKPKVQRGGTDWIFDASDTGFDFTRPVPEYFQNLENNIDRLDSLGVQADLILFNPYDRWGFARMGLENNLAYLKYIIARLASYKNVWWALANEYDLMDLVGQIPLKDWDRIGQYVHEKDPSQHLESIHNFYDPPQHKDTTKNWYDHTKPWISHLSIQSDNVFMIPKWIQEYQKPVINDECRYEGNIEFGWGDNTAKGMMDSFWRIILRGGGCTHGETYIDKPDTERPIWWAHGGKLYGESHKKIAFLDKLLKDNGFSWVKPQATSGPHWELAAGSTPDEKTWLVYFGENQPEFEILDFLPMGKKYSAKLINAWDETITDFDQEISGEQKFHLPRNDFQALLLTEE